MARNQNSGRTTVIVLLIVLILLMIAATGFVIWLCIDLTGSDAAPIPTEAPAVTMPAATEPAEEAPTEPPTEATTLPPQEEVVATATIGSMGDLLMHKPILDVSKKDGQYDFTNIFKYITPYLQELDFTAANLETTLAGDKRPYQGNPNFNCPDSFIDYVKEAGFDMLLTANNHSYDTSTEGFHRTLEIVRGKELVTLGTHDKEEEKRYVVQDVNGIKLGMICYTYSATINGKLALNGLPMVKADWPLVNHYEPTKVDAFYTEMEQRVNEMRADGAEAIIVYMHWGPQEYALTANPLHVKMSQKMCDLGVDVVIGGHPHVIQPMDLLESTVDPSHKTVVLYSMGNAVSNQRSGMNTLFPRGYTEDGLLFQLTFEKYSDGKVYLLDANVLPTWVNLHGKPGAREFNIVPLDKARQDEWKELYGLDDNTFNNASKSHDRTMELVGEGLEKCKEYLAQEKIDRDQHYYDLAHFPEKFAAEATETVETEEVTEPATEPVLDDAA